MEHDVFTPKSHENRVATAFDAIFRPLLRSVPPFRFTVLQRRPGPGPTGTAQRVPSADVVRVVSRSRALEPGPRSRRTSESREVLLARHGRGAQLLRRLLRSRYDRELETCGSQRYTPILTPHPASWDLETI